MKKIILLFALILSTLAGNKGFAASPVLNGCALPGPAIIKSPVQNATSFSIIWSNVPGAVLYHVEVTEYISGNPVTDFVTDLTNATINGLLPGTQYKVSISATGCLNEPVYGEPTSIVISTSIIIGDIIIQYDCPSPNRRETWINGQVQFPIPVDGSASRRIKVASFQANQPGMYDFYITAASQDLRISPVDSSFWRGENLLSEYLVGNNQFKVLIMSATANEMTVTVQAMQNNLSIYSSSCNATGRGRDATETPAQASETSIFPNPFSDHLTILQPLVPNRKAADLTVFNALGSVVYRTILQADETRISTADWPDGLYYVQVKNGGEITTYKAVK